MISEQSKKQVLVIWTKYTKSNKVVRDTKGKYVSDIDGSRLKAIEYIKKLVADFVEGKMPLADFKTTLDGYNKRNNLWGFRAAKGQMFFNQLVNSVPSTAAVEPLLISSIQEPKTLDEALKRIEVFEAFVRQIFDKADDKRRVPKPSSIGYFLSYFWQIADNEKWPILYSSQVNSWKELGMWKEYPTQREEYDYFFKLNEYLKKFLFEADGHAVSNWELEHAFWNHSGNPHHKIKGEGEPVPQQKEVPLQLTANFNVSEYVIPRVAKLVELGKSKDKGKGSEFEKMVAEVFKLLDFEVEVLGQGTGRNPDAIIKYRSSHGSCPHETLSTPNSIPFSEGSPLRDSAATNFILLTNTHLERIRCWLLVFRKWSFIFSFFTFRLFSFCLGQ